MFDNLYDNIGEKIKRLAKWTFIVEAVSAVITGFVLLFDGDDSFWWGLLLIFCGPVVAWVSSWLLYAFGDIVDNISAIRNKYVGMPFTPPAQPFTKIAAPTTTNTIFNSAASTAPTKNNDNINVSASANVNTAPSITQSEKKKNNAYILTDDKDVYVSGKAFPAGKVTFVATNTKGGMVLIYSDANILEDRFFVDTKAKSRVKEGYKVKLFDCTINELYHN